MFEFRQISADDPVLDQSPLVRALDFLLAKFDEHPNGIPLTKSLAFKRDLVADAIIEIQWPDWTEQQIYHGYMPIKIADEQHFEPFRDLHHPPCESKVGAPLQGQTAAEQNWQNIVCGSLSAVPSSRAICTF